MISVIIPSYNRKDCVLGLLRDVFLQSDPDFEVIVVDDGSSDGSVEAIRHGFPGVRLMVNEKNGGPCVTRNRGIMAAHGSIIVGLDSDVTVPDRDLLAKVRKAFAATPGAAGFAFRIFEPGGVSDDAPRWWHPLPPRNSGSRFETDYFSGTAYAFQREVVLQAGLFPEIFYMHYEEVELALRILDRSGAIYYNPELTAVHHANPVSRRSEVKVFYKPRNQVLLALRCYPFWRGATYLLPRLAHGMLQGVLNRTFGDWVRAMRSAAGLAPRCLAERKPIDVVVWRRIAAMKHQPLDPVKDADAPELPLATHRPMTK